MRQIWIDKPRGGNPRGGKPKGGKPILDKQHSIPAPRDYEDFPDAYPHHSDRRKANPVLSLPTLLPDPVIQHRGNAPDLPHRLALGGAETW